MLGRFQGLKVQCVFGGTNMNKDLTGFKAGPKILIATPGRLNDHLQNHALQPYAPHSPHPLAPSQHYHAPQPCAPPR